MKSLIWSLALPLLCFGEATLPKKSYIPSPTDYAPPLIEGYNAPSRVDVRASWDMNFGGEFLFWIPKEHGLEFALSNGTSSTSSIVGRKLEPDYKFRPGFNLSLGGYSNLDNWEVSLDYSWLYFKDHVTTQAPSNGTLSMRWFSGAPNATEASSTWSFRYNQFDLEMGRAFFTGTRLSLRPFLGIRTLWFHQGYKIRAHISALSGLEKRSLNKGKGWALGPKIGTNTNWNLGAGFALRGKLASFLAYFKTRSKTLIDDVTTTQDIHAFRVRAIDRELLPGLDLTLGLSWGSYFSHYLWHINLYADYTFQTIFQFNTMRALVDETLSQVGASPGNLTLQGLRFGLRFDF